MRPAVIAMTVCLMLFYGCTNNLYIANVSEKSTSIASKIENKQSNYVSAAEIISNPFFFNGKMSNTTYTSRFTFAGISLPTEVELSIIEVFRHENGTLYELRINCDEDFENRYDFGHDRFQIGVFYVQPDKIYMLDKSYILLDSVEESDIIENSTIVCQEDEIKDVLPESEKGWHKYISVDGNIREYHAFNNSVETGYYEMLIWEKDKGLVGYKSGFGAERDDIELRFVPQE